ncbi:hypothetical protein CCAN11_2290028 [Capnocytophaga canimorsus]|uniref:Uncharacterized protein n=1 Tax=Capnocytophaga canimorsus TaxID=28188 RepID=A0A0B7IMY4_9FLAO|nr:hypothetical protein CCAN11_2290028 [Capnocytophaga canimorsus]
MILLKLKKLVSKKSAFGFGKFNREIKPKQTNTNRYKLMNFRLLWEKKIKVVDLCLFC